MTIINIILLLFVYPCTCELIDMLVDFKPKVEIDSGPIKGYLKLSHSGKSFAAFEGIPYATPPIGDLRFKVPKPIKKWSNIMETIRPGNKCIQFDQVVNPNEAIGSEDCLYLNVYSRNVSRSSSLPVIIHIHPGAFMFGEGSMFGPEYLLNKMVVLVTFNYRLGPLGFLNTGTNIVPGNMGLKDQVFVMKWVKRNIKLFGGNPNNVTLMGISAGGASVHYHLLSTMSKGLFHKAIAQSGSALQPWAQSTKIVEKTRQLASHLDCSSVNTTYMIKCLQTKSANDIVMAQLIFQDWRIVMFSNFVPSVETESLNAFLTISPFQATINNGIINDVPLLMSVTSSEGLYPAALYLRNPIYLKELDDNWTELSSNIFMYRDTSPLNTRAQVATKIKQHYFNDMPVCNETFPNIVQALGDRHFVADVGKTAQLYASVAHSAVYMYRYSFRGAFSLSEVYARNNVDYGASHADDSFHIGHSAIADILRGDDVDMMHELIDMVYKFASTGVATFSKVKWLPVSKHENDALSYLEIFSPYNYTMEEATDLGNKQFWQSLGFEENENSVWPGNFIINSSGYRVVRVSLWFLIITLFVCIGL